MKTTTIIRKELEAEVAVVQQLSQCVSVELDAIRSNDFGRLSELVVKKESLLSDLEARRVRREKVVADACAANLATSTTLAALLDRMDDADAQPLLRLRMELLRHIAKLRQMNQTGRRYSRRQIRFISEAKSVLSGEDTVNAGEYLPSGTTRNAPSSGIALDMKV